MASDRARARLSPIALILVATAISGGSGYLVTAIASYRLDEARYALFAVFWSALYLVIGASGGVQQEVTRAASPIEGEQDPGRSTGAVRVLGFAVVVAVALFVLLAATGPLWSSWLFAGAENAFVLPLALGAASYILVASLCGALYGVKAWRAVAVMIAIDGLLRLAGILLALSLGGPLEALAWAAVLPFPVAVAVVMPFVVRGLRSNLSVDVTVRQLGWNVGRTVLASAATASIISGFPVLLQGTSPGTDPAVIAPVILSLMLTRAPIVIPIMALQSYLIVDFRAHRDSLLRRWARIEVVVLAAAAVATVAAVALGPQLIVAVLGARYDIDAGLLGVIVASSALVAALCVSSPVLISQSLHGANLAGWAIAAIGTVAGLLLPLGFVPRVEIALILGPLLGLLVHLPFVLAAGRRNSPRASRG